MVPEYSLFSHWFTYIFCVQLAGKFWYQGLWNNERYNIVYLSIYNKYHLFLSPGVILFNVYADTVRQKPCIYKFHILVFFSYINALLRHTSVTQKIADLQAHNVLRCLSTSQLTVAKCVCKLILSGRPSHHDIFLDMSWCIILYFILHWKSFDSFTHLTDVQYIVNTKKLFYTYFGYLKIADLQAHNWSSHNVCRELEDRLF